MNCANCGHEKVIHDEGCSFSDPVRDCDCTSFRPDDVEADKRFPLVATSPRDWSEDFHLENGQYECRCIYCELSFTGYKRRIVCKVCDQNGEIAATFSELRKRLTAEITRREELQRQIEEMDVAITINRTDDATDMLELRSRLTEAEQVIERIASIASQTGVYGAAGLACEYMDAKVKYPRPVDKEKE